MNVVLLNFYIVFYNSVLVFSILHDICFLTNFKLKWNHMCRRRAHEITIVIFCLLDLFHFCHRREDHKSLWSNQGGCGHCRRSWPWGIWDSWGLNASLRECSIDSVMETCWDSDHGARCRWIGRFWPWIVLVMVPYQPYPFPSNLSKLLKFRQNIY